ncbi:MAG: SBBP repeat-containing protein [Blastocatellia bacterium]
MNIRFNRVFCFLFLLLSLFTAASQVRRETAAARLSPADEATRARLNEAYGKLPLAFEVNRGQAPGDVRFLSAHSNYLIQLSPGAVAMRLRGAESKTSAQVRIGFVGANPAPRIEGSDELITKSNYLTGADPRAWRTNIPNYARVRYHELWPGVDAVFYGNQQQLEYDFVIAPGANPRAVKLAFEGVEKLRVDASDDLILQLPAGELRQKKPIVYQQINGEKRLVEGRYVVKGKQVGFEIGDYDRSRELVIDPVLNYLARVPAGRSIAVDSQGAAYIAAANVTAPGQEDVLVMKINPAGTQQIFRTLIGGLDIEQAREIAVDAAGSAYVTGGTLSTDFPGEFPGATSGASSGVCFKTTDGATNWSNSGRGLPNGQMRSLVIDPNNPMTLYAQVSDSVGRSPLYRSSDGGKNWTPVNFGNATRVRPLAVLPGNSNVIFASTSGGLQKSIDGGATWSESGLNVADIPDFVIDRKNTLICYAATNLGVYKSIDGGNAWSLANTGLPSSFYVRQLESNPVTTSTLYAIGVGSTPSPRLYKTTDGAATWEDVTPSGNLIALAVDPINSSVVYVGTDRGVLKSIDGGGNWRPAGLDDYFILLIAIDPANPATLYASTPYQEVSTPAGLRSESSGGVFKSVNGGASWFTSDNLVKKVPVDVLAIDPLNPATVYAGTPANLEAFVLKLNPSGDGLVYSTLLGGSGNDAGAGIAVDQAGSAYVTGQFNSLPLGFVRNGFQTDPGQGFMAKLSPQGNGVAYSTLTPGEGVGIAVDGAGKAYVAGFSGPTPLLPAKNGFQTTPAGATDVFVLKIDPEKSGEDSLLYSTYLGGTSLDFAQAMALDAGGRVYVTGGGSPDFPVTPNTFRSQPTGPFITKIDPAKSGQASLLWSTRFSAEQVTAIAVDAQGNLYVTGSARPDFPTTPGALQSVFAGSCSPAPACSCPLVMGFCPLRCQFNSPPPCSDVFVSKITADGAALAYSTFLGSATDNLAEIANDIALDAAGNVYLTGIVNLPATAGALQTAAEGFIAKLTLDARNTSVASVSAASFLGPQLAPESLAVGFLDAFGAGSDKLKVVVRDSAGTERDAAVLFSGFGQVNFLIPTGTADGDATVKVTSGGAAIATGKIQIASVAPGVFTANANGRGVAAAVVQRVRADGSQAFEMLARFDQSQNRWVATPIDLGPESDQVFIALFGTGWRFRSSESAVRVTIGGVEVPLLYAGLQPTLTGVDQINVRLPRSLAGKGEVDVVVTVDGKMANTANVNIK